MQYGEAALGAANSFPGPVVQRLGRNVARPLESLGVPRGIVAAQVLLRCALGLGAAAGAAQAAGAADVTVAASAVLATLLLIAAAVWGGVGLNTVTSAVHLVRNPDSGLSRFVAVSFLYFPLLLGENFLVFVWSPGRLVDIAVGLEMVVLVPAILLLAGRVHGPRARRVWESRAVGAAFVFAAFSLGPVLFAAVWALAGGDEEFSAVLWLLVAGAAASAVHWVAVRRVLLHARDRSPLSFLRFEQGGRPGLGRSYVIASFAPAPALLVLAALLGPASLLFFFPAAAGLVFGLVVERLLLARAAERSPLFSNIRSLSPKATHDRDQGEEEGGEGGEPGAMALSP
jgi:hypothetical protein